jgi:mannose-6-phosphate isomerase-like protein (cupin superfamily)
MGDRELVVRVGEVEPFSLPGHEDVFQSRCIICSDGVGSEDLEISHFILRAGRLTEDDAHPENDEAYYVLSGSARVTLGGPVESGGKEYQIGPDTAVFIPAGTLHHLDTRDSKEDLALLGIWPKEPRPGGNAIFDERKKAWGTSFRKVSQAEA